MWLWTRLSDNGYHNFKGKLNDFLLKTLPGAAVIAATAARPPNWLSLPPPGLALLKPARNAW